VRRFGWPVVLVALALVGAVACGGSKSSGDDGLGGNTTTPTSAPVECTGKTLTAGEIGVTPTEIKVTVMADVGSPLSPGLFQGSIDGVKAWADYVNANGGLACRQVTVETSDSRLSPDEAKNGIVTACGNSLALVGTTALFLNDMRPAASCKDKAGAATGLPDLAVVQTEPVEQCSPLSYAVIPNAGTCSYSGKGVRHFKSVTPAIEWFKKNLTTDLHGVFIVPADLPSTITSSTPLFHAIQSLGVKKDAEFGASGLWTQSQYTPVVGSIKSAEATYVMNMLDYAGSVKLRKEALAQGVTSVKVWACALQCYAPGFLASGGAAVEGHYAWLQFLPFEDKGTNPTLDAFLKYDKKPDGFGVQAFAAGLLLQRVVDAIVAKDGPNAVTRKAILDEIKNVHDFDADGLLVETDVAGKNPGPCIVIVQVQQGKWVRVDPEKKGTFDCSQPSSITEFDLDPVAAYKPSS
jgi:ABC-type branched-subunit amino acid transport system substrate-binding protein